MLAPRATTPSYTGPVAPPLVLLHPFPLDPAAWDEVAAPLAGACEVHVPALPGLGGAPRHPHPSIDAYADVVAAGVAALPGGRAVVGGVSMGGYVALSLAARRPELVAGLALVDTKAEADDERAREGRRAGIATIATEGPGPFLDALLPRLVAPGAPADVTERVRAIAERQEPGGLADALLAMRDRPDRSADLAAMDVPALVAVGELDAVTPPAIARALAAALPDARLEIVAGAGHLVPVEAPAAIVPALRDLLARAGG